MSSESQTAERPALASLKVVVDESVARDELRVHPAMFALLQAAFLEADMSRGIKHGE